MPQHTKKAMRSRKKELKANPKPRTHAHTSHGTHTATNAMHTVPLTQFPDSFSFTPREPHEEAATLAVAVAVAVAATTDLKC